MWHHCGSFLYVLTYLQHTQHIRQCGLVFCHRREEDKEVVCGSIREQLEVVWGVLQWKGITRIVWVWGVGVWMWGVGVWVWGVGVHVAWQIRRIWWHTANLIPTLHSTTNASLLSIVIAACGRNTGDRLQLWCYVRTYIHTYIHTYISVTRAREERGQWLPYA